jgi:hypothetical protein
LGLAPHTFAGKSVKKPLPGSTETNFNLADKVRELYKSMGERSVEEQYRLDDLTTVPPSLVNEIKQLLNGIHGKLTNTVTSYHNTLYRMRFGSLEKFDKSKKRGDLPDDVQQGEIVPKFGEDPVNYFWHNEWQRTRPFTAAANVPELCKLKAALSVVLHWAGNRGVAREITGEQEYCYQALEGQFGDLSLTNTLAFELNDDTLCQLLGCPTGTRTVAQMGQRLGSCGCFQLWGNRRRAFDKESECLRWEALKSLCAECLNAHRDTEFNMNEILPNFYVIRNDAEYRRRLGEIEAGKPGSSGYFCKQVRCKKIDDVTLSDEELLYEILLGRLRNAGLRAGTA